MPDRERDLERELRELGSRLEYPPTPDLARATRERLEEEQADEERRAVRRGRFWLPALSPRWAVAAMFVVVLAVPALSPSARDALSGLLVASGGGASSGAGGGVAQSGGDAEGEAGEAGEDKMMSEQAGSQAASAEAEDIPSSAGGGQADSEAEGDIPDSGGGGQEADGGQIGCRDCGGILAKNKMYPKQITLRQARIQLGEGTPVLLPQRATSDKPDAVYKISPSGKGLTLVYRARAALPAFGNTEVGMVLTETPGDLESTYLEESFYQEDGPKRAMFEQVKVDGGSGYWSPRWPAYWVPGLRRGPSSLPSPTESVLLWEQDGLALRLESNLSREKAIRIAESVR